MHLQIFKKFCHTVFEEFDPKLMDDDDDDETP